MPSCPPQVDVTPPPVATTDEEEMQYLNQLLNEVVLLRTVSEVRLDVRVGVMQVP